MNDRPMRAALLAAMTLLACAATTEPTAEQTQQLGEALCKSVSGTPVLPALVVTDPTVLSRFTFERTMTQLLTSAGSTQTPLEVWAQWMSTFGDGPNGCNSSGIDPNGYGLTCPRGNEASLGALDPFSDGPAKMAPLALFNRFDLTPGDASTCGEYRIVYGMTSGGARRRGLVIFEGALPNPSPAKGLDGCLPVARFWQSLPSASARLGDQLEAFYYLGTALPGVGPVVDAAHYSSPGQIRTNMFVGLPVAAEQQWNLREFKTRVSGTTLTIAHVTAKNNPANELFDGFSSKAPNFQAAFLDTVPALAQTVDGGVAAIAMSTKNGFNEFESISQLPTTDVVYAQHTEAAFQQAIQAKLTAIGSPLTVTQLLNRATTQTCGGCHGLSGSNSDLGQGLRFPTDQALRFVHVSDLTRDDGTGNSLSGALKNVFLPYRRQVLEDFINARCAGVAVQVPADTTLGGGAVGAPN